MSVIVSKVIERYNQAKLKNIKDIRLSIEEAEQLITILVCALDNKSTNDEKIIQLQTEIIELQRKKLSQSSVDFSNLTIEGDGGTF